MCLRISGWTEVELRGLQTLASAELSRRLGVLPHDLLEAATSLGAFQAIAGEFAVEDDGVCFIPRFPFLDATSYALLIDSLSEEDGGGREVWTIERPRRDGAPSADVVAMYPSAGEVPVNLLKIYIYFSAPMSEGWAARAVHVRRTGDATPLDGVFLASETELWDRAHRRLTLLLDPGRIKRGLVPNEEAGYPLVDGQTVVVGVETSFRDASGQPLRAGAEREYEVGPPIRIRIDPASWRRDAPRSGSTEPLTVAFDRSLDRALLEHSLQVHDAIGRAVGGQGSVGAGERTWRFEPRSPWEAGRYQVIVDPRLEDLAGNSLTRVFDRDLTRAADEPADVPRAAIEFICEPRA